MVEPSSRKTKVQSTNGIDGVTIKKEGRKEANGVVFSEDEEFGFRWDRGKSCHESQS